MSRGYEQDESGLLAVACGYGPTPRSSDLGLCLVPLLSLTTSLVGVEILARARRHGISDDDIRHAVENSVTGRRSDDETGCAMLVGPDQSGNLIEVGIVVTDTSSTQFMRWEHETDTRIGCDQKWQRRKSTHAT